MIHSIFSGLIFVGVLIIGLQFAFELIKNGSFGAVAFGVVIIFLFVWGAWRRFGAGSFLNRTKKSGGLHDVFETAAALQKLKKPFVQQTGEPVNVGQYFSKGIVGKPKPAVIPPEVFHKNHVSIIGASGAGKSKLAAQILTQLNKSGDSIVCFDPKFDEFLPGIIAENAQKTGRPFIYINLREPVPQINPLGGCTLEQRVQALEAGLNLDPTGDPGVDFYRGEDRDACLSMIKTGFENIPQLVQAGGELKACTDRQNFWREMLSLASLEAFQTDKWVDFEDIIQKGGVIYIVGDTDDLRIMAAQRLLLARILQVIKSRRRESAKQVCLFLDEFKYLLSNVSLRALGTIRDRRCNLILAYQSFGDLEDCGTLKAKAVLGAAKGNTTLKFVYKLEDVQTAEDFVTMAGEVRGSTESRSKLLKDGLQDGSFRETNIGAITVDMLTTNAPKPMAGEASVCWVFGIGPAFPIATMHLPAGPQLEVLEQPKVAGITPVSAAQTSAELI